jgi:alpha-ketoglutarate-dependent 2,4-dichlorophenoxyacetate dioxygenase
VTPYLAGGRAHRLSDVRLFDVGNIELDGKVFELDNVRREWNKVCQSSRPFFASN